MIRITLAAAVNDEAILAGNLQASPDVKSGQLALHCYRGYRSAGLAYNQAIDELSNDCDWIAFAHQDVYLPAGFLDRLADRLMELEIKDPGAALAGLTGTSERDGLAGTVWCSANNCEFKGILPLPTKVDSFDEYLILIKPRTGLRFDENLPSYHLFATDICLIAKAAGFNAWVLDVPVIHNSRPVVTLDKMYRRAWRYMQKKWPGDMPIHNLICPITDSSWPLWLKYFQIKKRHRFRLKRGPMLRNPAQKAVELGYQSLD
jgi:hypothetical protein